MAERIEGLEEAEKLAAGYRTPRTLKLQRLKDYVDGTQYDGRPDWFAPERDVPLLERKPCIVHPAPELAIQQHVDFALGEGRFAKLTTGASEDESDLDDLTGLTEEQSKTLDRFLTYLCDHARFQDLTQDALESAEGVSTAVVVFAACDGELVGEAVDAVHSTPRLAPNGRDVLSLEIKYPYVDIFKDEQTGRLRARCLLYRRVIDDQADTVYEPAKALPKGKEPAWSVDEEQTRVHALGFCPVVWYPFKRRVRKANDIDGKALHASQLDELDGLNFALSQRQRAAIYSGDPQMVEYGVSKNEQVAPQGEVLKAFGGYQYLGYSERPKVARKKGAGTVWRYENPNAKAELLTLPGDSLKATSDNAQDLLSKIESVFGYTATSPEQVKGALSGKALKILFARTTAFVDRVRRDLWDGFMRPALSLLLRMVHTIEGREPGSLYITGAKKVLPVLSAFERETEGGAKRWFCPRIKPTWGPYFEDTPEDEKAVVDTAAAAHEKGLVTREIAVEKVRGVFAFDNAAEIAEQLDAEAEEAEAAEAKALEQAAKAVPAVAPGMPGAKKPLATKPKAPVKK